MRLVYIFLCALFLVYILFKKRKIDFVLIYAIGAITYSLPLLTGQIFYVQILERRNIHVPMPIYPLTYLACILNLCICFVWILIQDANTLPSSTRQKASRTQNIISLDELLAMGIFTMLSYAIFALVIYRHRDLMLGGEFNKVLLLQQSSEIDTIAMYAALFLFVYAFTNKGKGIWALRLTSIPAILFTVWMGNRSFIVLGAIAILYKFVLTKHPYESLVEVARKHKILTLGAICITLLTFISKNLISSLVELDFKGLIRLISSEGFILQSFQYGEPNAITLNLQEILRNNYSVSFESYRYAAFKLIPWVEHLTFGVIFPVNFNAEMQPVLFPHITSESFGVAYSFLGEAIANGGFLLMFLVINLLMYITVKLDSLISSIRNTFAITGILCFLPYCTFYVFRNSIGNVFSVFRTCSCLYLLAYGIQWAILSYLNSKRPAPEV